MLISRAIEMMKSSLATRVLWGAVASAMCDGASAQTIVAGPIKNAANEHRYSLIKANSWAHAQSIARARGGDLATINDAAENDWVVANFTTGGKKLFIGLSDAATPGTFAWSDGSTSTYRNWDVNQPGSNSDYAQLRSDKSWATAIVQPDSLYLVEIAGPIRVPQEYADIDDAFEAMSTLQYFELDIGNELLLINLPHTITVPTGKVGKIRGAGQNATRIRLWEPVSVLDLRGAWDINDVAFWRVDDDSYIRLSGGRVRLSDVYLTCFSDLGPRLLALGSGTNVEMRRCSVGRSRGGPVFTGEGPLGASVTAVDSLFVQAVAITNANVSATLSSCTLYVCGLSNRGPVFNGAAALANTLVYRPNTGMGSGVTAEYCAFPYAYPGEGNIIGDPTFVPGGYRPAEGAIVINAGSASVGWTSGQDIERKPRVTDGQIDIGAHEYQAVTCDADFNRDGFISFDDFDDFVRAFESGC